MAFRNSETVSFSNNIRLSLQQPGRHGPSVEKTGASGEECSDLLDVFGRIADIKEQMPVTTACSVAFFSCQTIAMPPTHVQEMRGVKETMRKTRVTLKEQQH